MAKYLIHAVPKRLWYVNDHLIPSMLEQGINQKDISVYCDKNKDGNLHSFLQSLKGLQEDTWHLQDDVIIGRRFKAVTENVDGVVCAFCSIYSEDKPYGLVDVRDMWYSFPCIRIPVAYSQEFQEWTQTDALKSPLYRSWVAVGKYDDSLFMAFMMHRHGKDKVLNLNPNIVNHIDYLIGGSVVNKIRAKQATSIYWNERELLEYWEEKLKCR